MQILVKRSVIGAFALFAKRRGESFSKAAWSRSARENVLPCFYLLEAQRIRFAELTISQRTRFGRGCAI
jgi:hypothetical protein